MQLRSILLALALTSGQAAGQTIILPGEGPYDPCVDGPSSTSPPQGAGLPLLTEIVPADGSVMPDIGTVDVRVVATDPDGSTPEISVALSCKGSDLDAAQAQNSPFEHQWQKVNAGKCKLSIVATAADSDFVAVCPEFQVSAPGNEAPTVALTSPSVGQIFTAPASVTVQAVASDPDGGVDRVEFFRDGQLFYTDESMPYKYQWTDVAAGTYVVLARAFDGDGASTDSDPVTVVVQPGNQLPTVSITAPVDGSTRVTPGNIAFDAIAADGDGTIASVQFLRNGTVVATDDTSPYGVVLSDLPLGAQRLEARATDNRGGVGALARVDITVVANQAPTVALTAPANGAAYRAPASIALNATASDPDGSVQGVEFRIDGGNPSFASTPINGIYSATLNNVAAGNYRIEARARDNSSVYGTPVGVDVVVTANQPPVATIMEPTNGQGIMAPASPTFLVNASDPDGAVQRVELLRDGVVKDFDTSSPYELHVFNLARGAYTYQVRATDNEGLIGPLTSVSFEVRERPTLVFNSPANFSQHIAMNGAVASVPVSVSVTDPDSPIAYVDISIDGVHNKRVSSAPYLVDIDVPLGNHNIGVEATDTTGLRSGGHSRQVGVVVNSAPVVTVTSPAHNAAFVAAATINLAATATDTTGTVQYVDFYANGAPIGTATPGENGNHLFTWNGVSAGTYSVFARAADSFGVEGSSAPITVVVQASQLNVTLNAGAPNYPLGDPIALTAGTSTLPAGSTIRFREGSATLQNSTANTHTVNGATYGHHWYRAEVVQNGNVIGSSPQVKVGVVTRSNPSSLEPFQEYGRRVKAASMVEPLTSQLFGDQVSLYNGATEFAVTDIDLPGNNSLPVRLARRFKVEDRRSAKFLGGFGEWDIEVPYVVATVQAAKGWRIGAGNYARCTNAPAPDVSAGSFTQDEIWHGTHLHIPGEGDRELLKNRPNDPKLQPYLSASTYPWIARDFFRFSCVPSITKDDGSGGNVAGEGEGFVAHGPDGTRYHLTHAIERDDTSIRKGHIDNGTLAGYVQRKKVFLVVTRVEDRFGNRVDYIWNGDRLSSIQSVHNGVNERRIELTWSNGRIESALAHGRTWNYGYLVNPVAPQGGLKTVTLPDQSKWTYTIEDSLTATPAPPMPPFEGPEATCPEPFEGSGSFAMEIIHPAGARGRFTFDYQRHYRTRVPGYMPDDQTAFLTNCDVPPGAPSYQYLKTPNYFDVWSLTTKTLYRLNASPSPSLTAWSYTYNGGSQLTNVLRCGLDCPISKIVTINQFVNGAADSSVQHEFGVRYDENEGRLLSQRQFDVSGAELRQTAYQFTTEAEAGTADYPDTYGDSLLEKPDRQTIRVRPITRTDIVQDGVTFSRIDSDFDVFANARSTRRMSSLGGVADRTETMTYRHFPTPWVLGQLASVQVAAAGISSTGVVKPEETDYFETSALPRERKVFGRVDRTFQWNADGTLWKLSDGRTNTYTLSNYKRGVPQSIQMPTGASMAATVDDHGVLSSVTDAAGFPTTYGRDLMGRISSITYPDAPGDGLTWNNTSITYYQHGETENPPYGLPRRSWKRTEMTGNRTKEIYFDLLWRPVLERQYTTSGPAASQFVHRRYDQDNRVTFQSYPVGTFGTIDDNSPGVTTTYDALGRVIKVETDSEYGKLPVTTQYLAPLTMLVTNARGYQTSTRFLAFDQPAYDMPLGILAPEGVSTLFERDVFGKPRSMLRSGTWEGASVSLTRSYRYDDLQQLCVVSEPETGDTVMDYDAAGNVAWRATGQSVSGACNRVAAEPASSKFTYDAMNRVTGINHPSGTDDVGFTYYADGLMATAITPSTSWSYAYNERRLPTSETLSYGGRNVDIGWVYDANGAVSRVRYPHGFELSLEPDGFGRPKAMKTWPSGTAYVATNSIGYHPDGTISGYALGNGHQRTVVLNERQMVRHISDAKGPVLALDHELSYDANGNLSVLEDATTNQVESRTMTYDGLDRLIGTDPNPFDTHGAEVFAYDALDNLRRMTLGNHTYEYSYDGSKNRLQQVRYAAANLQWDYQYNARGEVTHRHENTAGEILDYGLTFDAAGRLTAATGKETYTYDAHGHRVMSLVAGGAKRWQVYSRAGQLLHVDDEDAGKRTDYLSLAGSFVARRETSLSTGQVSTIYMHSDARGTPSADSDLLGVVTYKNHLGAYGQPYHVQFRQGPGFTGHATDSATKLTYMQQRYYDPVAGRFLSPDPAGADAATGESFNRYAYANNNPYRFVDPDGRSYRSIGDRPSVQRSMVSVEGGIRGGSSSVFPVRRPGVPLPIPTPDMFRNAGEALNSIAQAAADAIEDKIRERVYVTYTLINSGGKVYVGRASGYGTPEEVMMRRFARHEWRLFGYGSPRLDQSAKGPQGYLAIRGREQQMIDKMGGVESSQVANIIRGVAKANPLGPIYHRAANIEFGELHFYTGL